MNSRIQRRLAKVIKVLDMQETLVRLALASEGEFIERAAQRSKKLLLDTRGKFYRALKAIEPELDEKGAEATRRLVPQITELLSADGTVDREALGKFASGLEPLWKEVSQATKGATSVLHFFGALEKFTVVLSLGSILQDEKIVARAQADGKVAEQYYEALERLAKLVPQVQANLAKSLSAVKAPEAPPAPAAQKAAPEEELLQQLTSAEVQMRGIVNQLQDLLLSKADGFFGDASPAATSLEENIFSIYNKRKVDPRLNRDKDFYQDALHLELGSNTIDLGIFLDNKKKKALYLSYRSFVMAVRALGMVQYAKANPQLVLNSSKFRELVKKAQEILVKRKDTIVKYLNSIKEEETEKSELGIPKGTFSDFFEKDLPLPQFN